MLDTLGWLYLRKGLLDRSVSLLEEAHGAAPHMPETQLHLALAYREAGRIDQARTLLAALAAAEGDPAFRTRAEEALDSLP